MKGKMKSDIKVNGSGEMKRYGGGRWKGKGRRKVGVSVNIKKKSKCLKN